MRRWEATLVIFALVATPLLLLSGSTTSGPDGCGRFCCLPHAAHNSPISHPIKAGQNAEMACHHGEAGHMLECGMKAGHGPFEYTFLTPIPPTVLSASAKLAAPEISRQGFDRQDESATTRILTPPFEPPRS